MLMAWVAQQNFSKKSRRFIANTNLNSRAWYLWRWSDDDEDCEDDESENTSSSFGPGGSNKKKALAYTPSFGNHSFWYKGWLLRFRRSQDRNQGGFLTASEREEIHISCFGRNPSILKQLLLEARDEYLRKDTKKTMIYRGGSRSGSTDPTWQRCMARNARPFSTVILNEKKKQEIIDDVADYLSPATRNWYSNRGIPWRRGYLLSGPPGTGKSSLSLALAGHFKMRIYIVSLSSFVANEESLTTLFSDLPQRCVVLLEDIDTAGLTHTREETGNNVVVVSKPDNEGQEATVAGTVPGQLTQGNQTTTTNSRLSLSGLLNILDGVASQEGRVLIMTTNHIEKLDRALIRPGRVDMTVQFTQADEEIIGAIFRAIYAPLEGDDGPKKSAAASLDVPLTPEEEAAVVAQAAKKVQETIERVEKQSHEFVKKVPAHEFSPAEIQGFLLKHKRSPEAALAGAEEWVEDARKQKKEKELKEAEEKRKEEEAKAAAAKAKAEAAAKTEAEKKETDGNKSDDKKPDEGKAEQTAQPETAARPSEKPTEVGREKNAETAVSEDQGKGEKKKKGPASDSGYDTPGES